MTYFYEGDEKWLSWLEGMGVHDPPVSGNAAQWPQFMTDNVKRAQEEWKKGFHSVVDWENKARPLLATWIQYYVIDRPKNTKGYVGKLLQKFPPKGVEHGKALHENIVGFLQSLSSDMKKKEGELGFHPELGGSIAQGIKIGPLDDWDFRLILSDKLTKNHPALKKLYTTLWECLHEKRQSLDSDFGHPLVLIGYTMNDSKLPSLVFEWRKPSVRDEKLDASVQDEHLSEIPHYIKVDLSPVIHDAPWKGNRKTDPLAGDVIKTQTYILQCRSNRQEPVEEDPTWKPSSCEVQHKVFQKLAPLLKYAIALLQILTSHTMVPNFSKGVPRTCKFTSHDIKNCLFWALSEKHLSRYMNPEVSEDTEDTTLIYLAAEDVLSSMRDEDFFTFGPASQPNQKHRFVKKMAFILLTGRNTMDVYGNNESASTIIPNNREVRTSFPVHVSSNTERASTITPSQRTVHAFQGNSSAMTPSHSSVHTGFQGYDSTSTPQLGSPLIGQNYGTVNNYYSVNHGHNSTITINAEPRGQSEKLKECEERIQQLEETVKTLQEDKLKDREHMKSLGDQVKQQKDMVAKQEVQIQQLFRMVCAGGNGKAPASDKLDVSNHEMPSTSTAAVPVVSSSEQPLKRRKVDLLPDEKINLG